MHEYLADASAVQYAAALSAALLIGLSKTGIAGTGVLMVPLMAGNFPAAASSGLMLPILVAGDVFAIVWYRRAAQWACVLRTLPWAVGGIVFGYVFMRSCFGEDARWPVSETALRRGIGVALLAMLALGAWLKRPSPAPVEDGENAPPPGGRWLAPLIGGMAGFTTMVANAAGPVWIVYMLLLGLPKRAFLGTTGWAFLIINLLKVPFSMHLGYIAPETLMFNVKMLPGLVVGAALGIWIVPRIGQELFNRLATVLAALAALNLALGPEIGAVLNLLSSQ